ncbi:ammonia channel protein AmtB [Methylohalomonas lacus]|uniref:Ammonia channel protein AmtB n=1 Tax=Methylohalomonas lacus TaxID=398773 RepID=A0AAE3HKA7_9GAMM|nr:ammonium transporter [Methylohalomonas lacus]MCS3902038.1 ammonia channel protein AmtB [Methylohalomonas lacus]
MDNELTALSTIFTEFYYWVTVVMMFLIHVGLVAYEFGATRPKNVNQTLIRHIMSLAIVTITWFLFAWWIYWAFNNGPFLFGGLISNDLTAAALPWAKEMGPHFQDHIWGVFWAAFLLFSWVMSAILSGVGIERVRTGAFMILSVLVGSVTWIWHASWGWHAEGWTTQLLGYHDAYASGVIHAIAGGACLALAIVLGPRIGKFGKNGEVRDIKPHNSFQAVIGLLIIYTGFWGFYAACNIPIMEFTAGGEAIFTATTIYGTPTTLSAITFNFLMSLTGGLMAGYIVSNRDPYWTVSCGLAGIIAASAGNDLYHPLIAMFVGIGGSVIAYKMHHYVERRFKIDDPVGAVAVHGYAGTFGLLACGFLLWGYPAAPAAPGVQDWAGSVGWLGTTPMGDPAINPLGMFIGAILCFGVFGFLATWIVCRVLNAMGILREPAEVEVAGADTWLEQDIYPYSAGAVTEFEAIELAEMNKRD